MRGPLDTLTRSQVEELENRRYAAMRDGDLESLDQLLSADVIYTHSTSDPRLVAV
jgi:ketosteroid isomerase-like protein